MNGNESQNSFLGQNTQQTETSPVRDISGNSLRASHTSSEPKRIKIAHRKREMTSSAHTYGKKAGKGQRIGLLNDPLFPTSNVKNFDGIE